MLLAVSLLGVVPARKEGEKLPIASVMLRESQAGAHVRILMRNMADPTC